MKKVFFLLILFMTSSWAFAQYETVVFDYERNYFNQGQALPAESYFILSGQIGQNIELVEVDIYKPRKNRKKPLYQSAWKRSYANVGENFEVPMNYKLRGGGEYDMVIKTYRRVNEVEKENLRKAIHSSLNAYVEGIVEVERKRFDIDRPVGAMVEDMNEIVRDGTSFYRNKINFTFPGFSDIITNKIKQLNNAKFRRGVFVMSTEKVEKRREAKRMYSQKMVEELEAALHTEVNQMLNSDLLVVSDTKEIRDYPVEKTKAILSLNAGYGGVYFDGNFEDLNYDHGPYVGLSIPLGNSALSSPFWSNTSISAGMFLTNFQDSNDTTTIISGPIFGRPYYVGLGYKVFQFIRLNAGAAIIEKRQETGIMFSVNEVKVKPFVGISAEINLWVGLGRK